MKVKTNSKIGVPKKLRISLNKMANLFNNIKNIKSVKAKTNLKECFKEGSTIKSSENSQASLIML